MTDIKKIARSGVDVGIAGSSVIAQMRTGASAQAGAGGITAAPLHAAGGERMNRVLMSLLQRLKPILYRVRQYFNRPLQEQLVRIEAGLAVASQMQEQLARIEADLAVSSQMQEQLARIEAGLAVSSQMQEQLVRIEADLAVASQMQELLARIEAGLAVSSQLQEQLERVEQYSQAAARRVALLVGPDEILIRTEVGFVLCAASDHALLATLIEAGELERGTRLLIERLLHPGDVFVDLGANIGMHTIAAARVVGHSGQVIAFEPYRRTMRLLERSVWLNGLASIVQLHEAAVSDHSGQQLLYLGKTSGHHSLYPLESSDSAGEKEVDVSVVRLDEAIDLTLPIRLIKIDVEGAELAVLEGCRALLAARPEIGLIVEFGRTHLVRSGQSPLLWLDAFRSFGLEYRLIDTVTGRLQALSDEQLFCAGTANLFFARAESTLWEAARA